MLGNSESWRGFWRMTRGQVCPWAILSSRQLSVPAIVVVAAKSTPTPANPASTPANPAPLLTAVTTKAKAAPNQVEPYVHLSSDDDNCSCILIPFLSPSSLHKLLQVKMQRLQRRRMPEKLPSRRTSMRRRRTRMRRRISIMRRRRTRMRRRLIPTIRRVRMEVHLHQDLRIRSRLHVRNQAPSQG